MYSTTRIIMPTLLNRNAVNERQWSFARCASGAFCCCFRRIDRLRSIDVYDCLLGTAAVAAAMVLRLATPRFQCCCCCRLRIGYARNTVVSSVESVCVADGSSSHRVGRRTAQHSFVVRVTAGRARSQSFGLASRRQAVRNRCACR